MERIRTLSRPHGRHRVRSGNSRIYSGFTGILQTRLGLLYLYIVGWQCQTHTLITPTKSSVVVLLWAGAFVSDLGVQFLWSSKPFCAETGDVETRKLVLLPSSCMVVCKYLWGWTYSGNTGVLQTRQWLLYLYVEGWRQCQKLTTTPTESWVVLLLWDKQWGGYWFEMPKASYDVTLMENKNVWMSTIFSKMGILVDAVFLIMIWYQQKFIPWLYRSSVPH